jgi:hypothetical protein
MNSPRCNAAQNTCTFSLIMCLKNLATNTLIPTGVATTARTRGSPYGDHICPLEDLGLLQRGRLFCPGLTLIAAQLGDWLV